MAIIRMLFSFLNNPRVIEKLAESRPIRRAAQITAYAITKAQIAGRDASERVLRSDTMRHVREEAQRTAQPGGDTMGDLGSRFKRVKETFVKEVKDGWKDGSREIKK